MGFRYTPIVQSIAQARWAYLLAPLLVAACTRSGPPVAAAPAPDDVPALQKAFMRDSTNAAIRFRLAEADRQANKRQAAVALLQPMVAREPLAAFDLGVIAEQDGRYADAHRQYADYLARGKDSALRDRAQRRLTLLGRLELEQSVRAALANERQLTSQPPEPRTVGVFPFRIVTTDPQLEPLGTALAELLTTDLAQTGRIRVVERVQVQKLLDEMALGASGRVDPATAARSGHLLGAGTIVQGHVDGARNTLTLQASVVRIPAPRARSAPIAERDALDHVFDLEKRLALEIYQRMGVELTVAERQRVTHQATTNVQALLELGLGLEAEDADRYGEAAAHFARAAQLDPGFTLAQQHLKDTHDLADAAATPSVALALMPGTPVDRTVPTVRTIDRFEQIEALVPNPSGRDAVSEALGAEGVGRHGTAQIVVRRP